MPTPHDDGPLRRRTTCRTSPGGNREAEHRAGHRRASWTAPGSAHHDVLQPEHGFVMHIHRRCIRGSQRGRARLLSGGERGTGGHARHRGSRLGTANLGVANPIPHESSTLAHGGSRDGLSTGRSPPRPISPEHSQAAFRHRRARRGPPAPAATGSASSAGDRSRRQSAATSPSPARCPSARSSP